MQRVKLGEQPDEGERSRRSVRKPVIMKVSVRHVLNIVVSVYGEKARSG